MKRVSVFAAAVIALGIVLFAGCAKGGGGSPDPNPEPTLEPKTATVIILEGAYTFDDDPDNDFSPSILKIEVGTTVTWINEDIVFHTVDTHDGALHSGNIDPGESWSYTFTKEGVYEYHCHPHPWMTGTVIVGDAHNSGDHGDGHGHENGEH